MDRRGAPARGDLRRRHGLRVGARWQLLVPLVLLAVAAGLLWWRGPEWELVRDAFTLVVWEWIVVAVVLNLLSIVVRALAWQTAITQAMEPPHPRFRLTFSAFCVGLFANAVLPARAGELARVAVLTRRMAGRIGAWPTLIGSVFAHRVFDLFPGLVLVVWVVFAAKLPHWALTSLIAVSCIGLALFAFAWISARRPSTDRSDELTALRALVTRARLGLGVMRAPVPAAIAAACQFAGWMCQLAAVWAVMRAFDIHLPLAAAGLVLVLMNIATIFPLWPGNVGLVQAAVALPLVPYGVAYGHGFAFGIGLQAVEASVGIGIGLLFLAREGISYATLREMPTSVDDEPAPGPAVGEREPARARLPG
jgi:uncharacterized membrane protein YbhN (UPF0104 family)